jgi:selenocysteine lyase/cysteine desulfurase
MNAIGFENIYARILQLTGKLMEGLDELGVRVVTPREDAFRAGIVSMDVDRPREIVHALAGRNIWVNLRGKYIRVSPNFYNNEQDISALLNSLKELRSL